LPFTADAEILKYLIHVDNRVKYFVSLELKFRDCHAMTLKFVVHSSWFLVKYKGKDKEGVRATVYVIATPAFGRLAMTGEEIGSQ